MATINGITGGVTFASGYVTSAFSWEMQVGGVIAETTGFAPVSSYRTFEDAALQSWRGSYKCRQTVKATAAIAGPSYLDTPYEYNLTFEADELEDTKFADTVRAYSLGLYKCTGTYITILDGTTALPVAATTANATFTVDTGKTYGVPLIVGDQITVGTANDGSTRIATVPFTATGAVTVTGALPLIGATGAATFTAATGRLYSGTILVSRIELRCNRQNPQGEWTISFLGNSALNAA